MVEKNGLEQAMILLMQNQAAFLSQITAMNERMDERFARSDERFERIDERFARVENELAEIKSILLQHGEILAKHEQILEALPEAIRQKIGFRARQ